MSRATSVKQLILDAVSRTTAAFTAATTDIITDTAHGLSNGDRVELTTTNTLPAGLELNTVYYVMKIDANTFKLAADKVLDGNGLAVDITDTGTGTHTWTVADSGESIMVQSYRHKEITISTSGMGAGDTTTIKIQGSSKETPPDFYLAKSASNEWDYIQIVALENGSTVDGDTGVSITDADDLQKFAINVDGLVWVNAEITTQSDTGTSVTVSINLYNDSY